MNIDESLEGITDNWKILFREGNAICRIKNDTRLNKNKVIITYGPFDTKEIAFTHGRSLFLQCKKKFVNSKIPITITKNTGLHDLCLERNKPACLTEFGRKHIEEILPDLKGKEYDEEVLGLEVYFLNNDIEDVKFIVQDFGLQKIHKTPEIDSNIHQSDMLLYVYSILNASNIINDIRVKYILLISAVESLVADKKYESKEYLSFVNSMIKELPTLSQKVTKDEQENDEDFKKIIQKIQNTLGKSKEKSIEKKCRDLIEGLHINELYCNKKPTVFFNECYSIRSKFIHAGIYNVDDINITIQQLESLVYKIVNELDRNEES